MFAFLSYYLFNQILGTINDKKLAVKWNTNAKAHWNFHISVSSRESGGHGRTSSQDITPGGYGTGAQDIIHGSQVVAVGTPLATSSLPIGAQQGPVMVCCIFP